ncbi:MAG: MupA/Atu3671 family FMN-dependent luciferase-like monooxygenase, partial [Myxococcota bacterium]
MRIAEEWALVDNLSDGRVGVAFASGWHADDFVFAPERFGRHRELTFAGVDQVRRLWRGDALQARGGAGNWLDIELFPQPKQAELPCWLTVVSNPETYARAGALGIGILTNLMSQSVESLADNLAIYRRALREHGHPGPGHVTVLMHTYLCPDHQEAIERARAPFCNYLRTTVKLFERLIRGMGMDVDWERLTPADMQYLLGAAYEDYIKTRALIGSPESCAPIVERLHDLGVTEIACFIDFGVDPDHALDGLPQIASLRRRHRARSRRPTRTDVSASARAALPAPVGEAAISEAMQQLLVLASMDENGSVAHNESMLLEVRGPLDVPALQVAVDQVVTRHEALRTAIDEHALKQVIYPPLSVPIREVNLEHLDEHARAEQLRELLERETRRPFDIARPPLFRIYAARLEPSLSQLLVVFHNLVLEGWSMALFMDELDALYTAARAGRRANLPEPLQFRDLLALRETYRLSEQKRTDEAFWLATFAGEIPALRLPSDRPRRGTAVHRGARVSDYLTRNTVAGLTRLGAQHRATLFMSLQATFIVLLHKLSGQERMVTAYSSSGRSTPGSEGIMGHGTHYVPVLSHLDPAATFNAYLRSASDHMLEIYSHQAYPFAWLISRIKPDHAPGRFPLAQVLFNMERSGLCSQLGAHSIRLLSPPIHYVQFEMHL